MAFKLLLQLHKGGSSTTNVQSYTPTAEEVRLQKSAADYAEYVAPNARWLNDTAANVLKDSIGTVQVDFNKMNDSAQDLIAGAQGGVVRLTSGYLPSQYQRNMEDSLQRGVQNTMGQQINSLANRGVLNSSVTNQAMNDMSKSVSDTMAEQYQNNIGTLNGLYGQQSQLATGGITAGAAAQEAALAPALSEWNASLGLNGAGTSALGAVSGQGTTTTTSSTSGGGGWLGGLVGLGSSAITAFCFIGETLIETFKGEKPIKDIKVGDQVFAFDEKEDKFVLREVVAVQAPRVEEVYKVTCVDDLGTESSAECSKEQPLLTNDGQWVDVSMLKINTVMKCAGTVKSIEKVGKKPVYDIFVDGNNNYLANGFVAEGMFEV